MKTKILSLAFALVGLLCLNATAQTPVTKYYYGKWIGFNKPVVLDSLNNQGKSFSIDDYISTPKWEDAYTNNSENTKEDGIITTGIHPCGAEDYNIVERFFKISTQKREKVKFEVYSNSKLKISIDGEKVSEKSTEEDEMTNETKVLVEKELNPGTHIIGISQLCLLSKGAGDNNEHYKLKTLLFTDDTKQNKMLDKSGLTLETMLCGENPYSVSISPKGDLYMVKYSKTDKKGNRTYRVEVRTTMNDNIVFEDKNILSYQWVTNCLDYKRTSLLYYKDGSTIYTLNPLTGEKETKEKDVTEGSITLGCDYTLVSKTSKRDNTSGDLHRMYLPDDRIPGWRDRTTICWSNGVPLFHTYRSTYLNDINDNNRILFSMSSNDITKRPFSFNSIYQYDLESNKMDTLIENDGFVSSAQYLKDGKNIFIVASNEAFNSLGSTVKKGMIPNAFNNSIYLMNLETKEIKAIGKNFNPSVKNVIVRKNNLYILCEDKDSINVYKYSLKDNTFTLLPLEVDIVHDFDVSEDEDRIVYYGENYNKPNRVFTYLYGKVKEVFFPKQEEFNNLSIGKMDKFSFKMHNSNIDGRLYYPADFDSTKKYPMIVYYYGGCSPTDRSFEMRYSAWLYTQQGYMVYVVNPSGTTGWGQEFAARHVNAWGDYTADEIIEGVKRVCKAYPFIDSKHIGCMGASYGGFMTQYLQTKTDIFACAISHAGISNITSYWGEGYWGYSYSGAATADNYPWNNPDLYTKHSPLFNADKIHTPLLLLHGTSDTNVPIGESIQMYNALKILGREVEFITVKGENHGIVDFNKRMQWNNTIYAWFAKWLKEDSSWWDELYPKEEF